MVSSWGPTCGSPAGMGVVSLVDTTAGYVTRLEKVTRDQTAKIMQLEAQVKELQDSKAAAALHYKAAESRFQDSVPALQQELRQKTDLFEASAASSQQQIHELKKQNEQLRKDVMALEGEVLGALHHGVEDPSSIWRTTVGEVVAMRDELVLLVQAHARECNNNAILKAELKQTRSEMLAALDRIHHLVTLNEPHQFFVANVMKERNFWQQMAKKAVSELEQVGAKTILKGKAGNGANGAKGGGAAGKGKGKAEDVAPPPPREVPMPPSWGVPPERTQSPFTTRPSSSGLTHRGVGVKPTLTRRKPGSLYGQYATEFIQRP